MHIFGYIFYSHVIYTQIRYYIYYNNIRWIAEMKNLRFRDSMKLKLLFYVHGETAYALYLHFQENAVPTRLGKNWPGTRLRSTFCLILIGNETSLVNKFYRTFSTCLRAYDNLL